MNDKGKAVAEEPKAIVRMTRRGVAVWILLILFIAVWMFILGILVGRGTAPVPLEADLLQQELSELKTALMQKEQADMEAQASGQTDQKTQLGFYEALKETKRQPPVVSRNAPGTAAKPAPGAAARLLLDVESKPSAATAPPEAAEKPREAVKPAPVEKAKADDKPVNKPAPAESKPVSATPRPEAARPAPPAKPGAGAFTVQVGAFKDRPGADQMVSRLRAKGYAAYQIRSESADKGIWYRVRVGAFDDRAAARNMLKKLEGDQFKGIVVGTP